MDGLRELVTSDPERLSGIPCFVGTRVPVHNLFDYLAGGDSLDEFLDNFPTVSREQAERLLHLAADYIDAAATQEARDKVAFTIPTRHSWG